MRAWKGDGTFRDNVAADPKVTAQLDEDALSRCFDIDHALTHVPAIIARALATGG